MRLEEVIERVNSIARIAWDDESAHSKEDALYEDVLREIAKGAIWNAPDLATAALKTKDIAFERWCA